MSYRYNDTNTNEEDARAPHPGYHGGFATSAPFDSASYVHPMSGGMTQPWSHAMVNAPSTGFFRSPQGSQVFPSERYNPQSQRANWSQAASLGADHQDTHYPGSHPQPPRHPPNPSNPSLSAHRHYSGTYSHGHNYQAPPYPSPYPASSMDISYPIAAILEEQPDSWAANLGAQTFFPAAITSSDLQLHEHSRPRLSKTATTCSQLMVTSHGASDQSSSQQIGSTTDQQAVKAFSNDGPSHPDFEAKTEWVDGVARTLYYPKEREDCDTDLVTIEVARITQEVRLKVYGMADRLARQNVSLKGGKRKQAYVGTRHEASEQWISNTRRRFPKSIDHWITHGPTTIPRGLYEEVLRERLRGRATQSKMEYAQSINYRCRPKSNLGQGLAAVAKDVHEGKVGKESLRNFETMGQMVEALKHEDTDESKLELQDLLACLGKKLCEATYAASLEQRPDGHAISSNAGRQV